MQKTRENAEQSAHQGVNSSDLLNKIKLADRCIIIDAEDHNSYYVKAVALIELWQLTKEASYFESAIDSYTGAINLAPDNALYLCDRGKAYHSRGKDDLAEPDLISARKLLHCVAEDTSEILYVRNTLNQILGNNNGANQNIDAEKKNSPLEDKVFKPIFEDADNDNMPQIQIQNQEQQGIVIFKEIQQHVDGSNLIGEINSNIE
jgi:tetratricopeptide (TPR) repeat protein